MARRQSNSRWFVLLAALGTALLCRQWRHGSLRHMVENVRAFSAPSAGLYDALLGSWSEPIFARVARRVASRVDTGSVLDVGCGPGRLAVRLAREAPGLTVTGMDVAPDMIRLARRRAASAGLTDRVRFEVGDVVAMPFADGQFDLVVSTFSMHHWPDPARGLAEIHRVLKPGGEACIYDMAGQLMRLFHHGRPAFLSEASRWFGGEATEDVWALGPVSTLRVLRLRREGEASPARDAEPVQEKRSTPRPRRATGRKATDQEG